MIKRSLITFGATVVCFMLMVGVANAHQCYVANRSEQGNQSAASNSEAWQSFRSIAEEFLGSINVCPLGVTHVIDGLIEAGIDVDVLLHQRATLAWNNKNQHLLADGKGVDYFDWDHLEATAGPLIWEAFGICS